MKIGLTGSIACGKSTVSSYLRTLGYPVVDADEISRSMTAPGGEALPAIRRQFGDAVFSGDVLDRRALGALVFSDEEKRAQLNALLHPLIISRIHAQLDALDTPDGLVFGDIPLLFECGMENRFSRIWVVSAPRSTLIKRLHERDGLSPEEACAHIDAQMPLHIKESRAHAVIDTSGSIEDTRRHVDRLLDHLKERIQA